MIQARTSTKFSHVLTWVVLVSLIFGFCSSWSLHFVGMLSCELHVAVGLDVSLTLFTGVLAVAFTFISLGKDLLRRSYACDYPQKPSKAYISQGSRTPTQDISAGMPLLLGHNTNNDRTSLEPNRVSLDREDALPILQDRAATGTAPSDRVLASRLTHAPTMNRANDVGQQNYRSNSGSGEGSEEGNGSSGRPHWSFGSSNVGSSRLEDLVSMATQGNKPHGNVFIATFWGLLGGISLETILMGLLWSLSLTCMHYGGLIAMEIPEGYMTLSPVPVVVSAIISWVVCIAGYIYMINVEPFLTQQILFSFVAAVGIASMHFTGKFYA